MSEDGVCDIPVNLAFHVGHLVFRIRGISCSGTRSFSSLVSDLKSADVTTIFLHVIDK